MATSAASVTGLASVDIQTYFSPFGEVVLLLALQVGGIGIMTVGSLLGVFVARRLGLQTRLLTQLETRTIDLGDVRRILRGVARFSKASSPSSR